jgi:hypothetical protein
VGGNNRRSKSSGDGVDANGKKDPSKRWMEGLADRDKVPLAQQEDTPGIWVVHTDWRDRTTADRKQDAGKLLALEPSRTTTFKNRSHVREQEFDIGVLASGQCYGELAVLDPDQTSPVTVISTTNLEVFAVKKDDLLGLGARFNTHMLNCLNTSMTMYNPPAEKVAHYLRSKAMWDGEKDKVLRDVMPDSWCNERESGMAAGSDGLTNYNRRLSVHNKQKRKTNMFKRTRGVTLMRRDL